MLCPILVFSMLTEIVPLYLSEGEYISGKNEATLMLLKGLLGYIKK